jgi:hypothetical protein
MFYLLSDEKEQPTTKKMNKFQPNKLEEKEIDTSNIVVEKKEEKKQITSWVVDADKVQDVFRKQFDMNKVDHEFESLTDDKKNEELKEVPIKPCRKPKSSLRKTKTNLRKSEALSSPL